MSGDGGWRGQCQQRPSIPETRRRVSGVVEMVAMLWIPVSFIQTFGVMVGDNKGWALFAAAAILFVGTVAIV
jgi:potassium-transporting ATPase potassium-binding subunit